MSAIEDARADERHDHASEPKVWCETHQHTHVATMPRFTFLCKDCGWGQWFGDAALAHEAWTEANRGIRHRTYDVEHVTRPVLSDAQVEAAARVFYESQTGQDTLSGSGYRDNWLRMARAALEAARDAS